MKRSTMVLLGVLLLGSCGGNGDEESPAPTSSTSAPAPGEGAGPPTWIRAVTDVEVTRAEPVEGNDVWVDEAGRKVYVEDCDLARRITQEGERYGPSPRDPETGEFTPGYSYVCP